MTDEQEQKILRASERLVKARRLWLEATATSQRLFVEHADSQKQEDALGSQVVAARREVEAAIYDVEGCRVCGEVVPEPFKLYCCGEHQEQGNRERRSTTDDR